MMDLDVTAFSTAQTTRLLLRLYSAAFSVDSGLRRECDHVVYEGATEPVDDLREILGILETDFGNLVFGDDDGE